ncbi:MAG: response regulator [Phycisphaerales bacterium]
MSSFDKKPIETIRMDDRDKRRVIDEFTSHKAQKKGPARDIRVTYGSDHVTLTIVNPGGNTSIYSVITRNLSRRGVAFLHGRFIYPGCRCSITLRTLDGESVSMDGKIVRCNHLGGMIHEAAMRFNSPIDLTLFAKMSPAELEAHSLEYERDVANGEIERGPVELGTILVVDSYRLDRRLFGTLLQQEGYSTLEGESAQDVTALMANQHYDLAVIDVCQNPLYGFELIGQLSGGPLGCPVLAVSADEDPETEAAAMNAGAGAFLSKPFNNEAFTDQVNKMLGNQGRDGGQADPIISALSQDEAMRPLLREFVGEARGVVDTLRLVGQKPRITTGCVCYVGNSRARGRLWI